MPTTASLPMYWICTSSQGLRRSSATLHASRNCVKRLVDLCGQHGGAWRSGDKSEHPTLIQGLCANPLGASVASLNYRLSPKEDTLKHVRHPAHEEDVIQAILFLVRRLHPADLYLCGHSCGTYLALGAIHSSPVVASLVRGVVCIDGIYDLAELVAEYPDYDGFVGAAFGPTASRPPAWDHSMFQQAKILLLHSRDDELLTLRQPKIFAESFRKARPVSWRTKLLRPR
jgi:kynurenine formamidase